MTIKFIKPTPFAIDQTKNHVVEKQFGSLMVAGGYAEEVKSLTKPKKQKNEK